MKSILLFGIWLAHIYCFAQKQNTNSFLVLESPITEINGSGQSVLSTSTTNGISLYEFKNTFLDSGNMEEHIKNQLSCTIKDNCEKDLHIDPDACLVQQPLFLIFRQQADSTFDYYIESNRNIGLDYDKSTSGLAYQFSKSLKFQLGYWNHIVHTRHIGQINLLTLNFKS